MGSAILQGGLFFLILRNRVFGMRKVQICVLTFCKGVDLLLPMNRVFKAAKHSHMGNAFLKLSQFAIEKIWFLDSNKCILGYCRPARVSICKC